MTGNDFPFNQIDNNWSLFLDRDGVINERIWGAYVQTPEEFHFLPGVLEALRIFKNHFARIVVVTNQQGIGKGIMTERNLHDVHRYMLEQVEEVDGRIDAVYFAPDLAGPVNQLRKPMPGMAHLAKNDFPEIDFEKAIMIGDTDSDMRFGRNLGMKVVRVLTDETIGVQHDLEVESLLEFAQLLKEK